MRTLIRCLLIIAFCLLSTLVANAQLSLVKGLPFEATRTRTVDIPGENYSVSGMVARSSNGSLYEEIPNPTTGEVNLIHITDVPDRRNIFLDVKRRLYSVYPADFISIGNGPSKEDLEKHIEVLKTLKPTRTVEDGYDTKTTYLGFRTQDGFMEFGRRTVYYSVPASSKLIEKVWEDWEILALSLTVEKIGFDSDNKPAQIIKFSNVQTKEPDTRLFEVPTGYIRSTTLPTK